MKMNICLAQILNLISVVLKTNLSNACNDLIGGKMHVTQGPCLSVPINGAPVIIGIDVPIIFYPDYLEGKPSDKTVVLIGQDPLRNPNDPVLTDSIYTNNTNFSQSDVIVGTPFAMHFYCNPSVAPSSYTFLPMYRTIIDGYLKKGYNVYLTDISKLYVKFTGSKGNDSFNRLMRDKQYLRGSVNLLCEEVKILSGISNVEACIFFGKTPHKRIRKELVNSPLSQLSQIKVINHPSDTRSGKGHWDGDHGINPHDWKAKANKIIGLVP